MQLIYVDDSMQQGRRVGMGKLIALGAVAFEEAQLKPFSDAFFAAYDYMGVPHDVEMKWSMGRRNWFVDNDVRSRQTPLRKLLLQAAGQHGAKVIVVIWDTKRVSSANGKGPEEGVIEFLFERITMMLENSPEHRLGAMVFDKPGGDHKKEDNWIEDRKYLTDLGTDYVKSTAIVIPILTAPSHHHPHLQLADLVTGSVTNAVAGGHHGLELLPVIRPLFHTNWRGNIGGTGLKLYPDKINNLQHWLLDESEFSRRMGAVTLPFERWDYYENDGILDGPA